jgi:hypothetical protein
MPYIPANQKKYAGGEVKETRIFDIVELSQDIFCLK